MPSKKRTYYIKEKHYIHGSQSKDADGNILIGIYHNKNTPLPKSIEHDGKKVTYTSLGHKISLSHKELIYKKYWRDVIFTSNAELADIQKEIRAAYPIAREKILKDKAARLGLPKSDEIVEKYLAGETAMR